MFKSRQTWQVLVIIFAMLLMLGIRLWANAQAVAVTGPMQLKRGGDGRLYVGVADRLIVLSEEGDIVERIPLSRFGVDKIIGDFIVSPQRDILLRGPRPESDIQRSLRILFRIGGDGGDQAVTGETVLQWCALNGGQCRPFASEFRSMRTFRLVSDEQTGALFVADTAQHHLLRLSKTGAIEKASAQDFQFPNGLLLGKDGLLLVADTNHHRIVAVTPDVQNFAVARHEFQVQTGESSLGRIWPTALAQTADGSIWVINGDGNMAFSDLMRYDSEGRFRSKVRLASGADPIAVLATHNGVIVTDPSLFEIYTFDLDGNKLGSFGGGDFYLEMKELKNRKSLYKNISNGALAILFGLVATVLWVYRKQVPQK